MAYTINALSALMSLRGDEALLGKDSYDKDKKQRGNAAYGFSQLVDQKWSELEQQTSTNNYPDNIQKTLLDLLGSQISAGKNPYLQGPMSAYWNRAEKGEGSIVSIGNNMSAWIPSELDGELYQKALDNVNDFFKDPKNEGSFFCILDKNGDVDHESIEQFLVELKNTNSNTPDQKFSQSISETISAMRMQQNLWLGQQLFSKANNSSILGSGDGFDDIF